jgi:hypothetical protein
MPEMKGRSLEELDEIFNARTPAWKFKEFQCTIKDEVAATMQEDSALQPEKKGNGFTSQVEDISGDKV